MSHSPLSTVLAQDHFYSDFLSLLLTKQIHFESVMMIASAQHSLSVLTFVKLMIECVVHLLSRFLSTKPHSCFVSSGGFGNGLLLQNNYLVYAAPSWRGFLAHLTIPHFACATLSCMSFVFSIVLCKSATNVSHCFALQWLAPA